jgi:chlorite dismutase
MRRYRQVVLIAILVGGLCQSSGHSVAAAADREKLLSEPGVYGTFALFSLGDTWTKQDQATRISQLTLFKGVVEQHREKIAIDLYLLRGLSDQADLMFRVHAAELRDTQQFLVDLQNSAFGKYLKGAGLMHGLTKKANYVPGFPDQLKADLKVVSEPGSKPYAIVIPVTKSADWWALDQEKRAAMMREHTEATLPYLTTVKRKLYHSSGLDDLDFITYFETSKLEDFHSLILSLEKVKEFRYTLRSGHPTLIGTAKSVDELIEALAQ